MKASKDIYRVLRKWHTAKSLAAALGVTLPTAGRYVRVLGPLLETKTLREGARGPASTSYRLRRG